MKENLEIPLNEEVDTNPPTVENLQEIQNENPKAELQELKKVEEVEKSQDNGLLLIQTSLKDICEELERLNKLFSDKLEQNDFDKRLVDQMGQELQKYRGDLYAQLIKPILVEIIELRDSIVRVSNAVSEKPEDQQVISLAMFSDYGFSLLDILDRYEIVSFRSEVGTPFVAQRQRVSQKMVTNDPDLHGKIAKSLLDGYIYRDKVISPEKIVVYVYEEPISQERTEN